MADQSIGRSPRDLDDLAYKVLEALPGKQNDIAQRLGRKRKDQTVRRRLRRLEEVGRAKRGPDGVWYDLAVGPPLYEAPAAEPEPEPEVEPTPPPAQVVQLPTRPRVVPDPPEDEEPAIEAPPAYVEIDGERYPSDFDADARELYIRTRGILERQETWHTTEPELLEQYVRRLQIARYARAALVDKEGRMRLTSKGSKKQTVAHPMLGEMKRAEDEAARLANELIITPEARHRHGIKDPRPPDAADDGF